MWSFYKSALSAAPSRALLPTLCPALTIQRTSHSFFDSKSAKELWKSVTMVSSQGKMRGRSKGLLRIKNLHRGQKLGFGKAKMIFPGLTDHAIVKKEGKREGNKMETMSEERYQKYEDELIEARAAGFVKRSARKRQTPLERGWTSASPQGRKFGPPDTESISGGTFDNFESILVEFRGIVQMTGQFGRVRNMRFLMITGNQDGLCGYSLTKSAFGVGSLAFRKAVNRAGNRVCHIDRYEDRTVFHDFFTQFGQTRIFVQQKPHGTGIQAHRIIVAICQLVGIKDLRAKIEGSLNPLNIVRAFFLGLLRQRTHQMLANEKQLHLVELREENHDFPLVVASPEDGKVRTEAEIGKDETLDFEMISYDGNLPFWRKNATRAKSLYPENPKRQFVRPMKVPSLHHKEQRHRLMVEEGKVESYLAKYFPECKEIRFVKSKPKEEAAE